MKLRERDFILLITFQNFSIQRRIKVQHSRGLKTFTILYQRSIIAKEYLDNKNNIEKEMSRKIKVLLDGW